jgi:hypothetical protein
MAIKAALISTWKTSETQSDARAAPARRPSTGSDALSRL